MGVVHTVCNFVSFSSFYQLLEEKRKVTKDKRKDHGAVKVNYNITKSLRQANRQNSAKFRKFTRLITACDKGTALLYQCILVNFCLCKPTYVKVGFGCM